MTTVVAGIPPRAPYRTARPHVSGREISVGLRGMGYLADHAVRDLVVLPGAFFLEVARATESESGGRRRHVLRNVVFENPFVVGGRGSTLRVARADRGDEGVEYAFVEVRDGDRGTSKTGTHTAARLVAEHSQAPVATDDTWSIDAFMALSPESIGAERFYTTLRENGNQYGPHFQRLSSVWRTGDQAFGELSAASPDRTTDPRFVRVTVLDAAMQLLSALSPHRGRPFMLQSIDTVVLTDDVLPGTLWAHAVAEQRRDRHTAGEAPFVGNVRVFDESGKLHADLRGIAFAFLDAADETSAIAATAAATVPTTTIAIASNFTAEPVEDSLRFWADHFGVPLRLEFAPYNQVFQQLLDPKSAIRTNRDGVNVIVLSLEEWATARQPVRAAFDMERAQQRLGARPRYTLPNGLEVAHLNAYETDYVYHEVFQDECYLRHGIALRDGDTVIDIGANIGLFSLFVMSRCRDARIIAFEPAPVVCDLLKANCDAYGANVEVVNAGVSGAPGEATFTFYERSSVFSGFHTDAAEDRRAVEAIVRNTLHSATSADDEAVERFVADLTEDRMHGTAHTCRMTSVSEIIRDRGLTKIDLLKVDAERSELDILRGIEESDWPKIEQVVLEIHDRTQQAVAAVTALLSAKGFDCAVEREQLLENSGLFNLYAKRSGPGDEKASDMAQGAERDVTRISGAHDTGAATSLNRNVSDFSEALGACMAASTVPMVLCVSPRTPASDTIRAELDAAEQSLLAAAAAMPNVHAIGSQVALQRYPVSDHYDAHSHQLGHVPYTPAGYAAIGSTVWRAVTALKRRPYKVIALDCDNVLWKGVCGEDGAMGIELTPAHLMLQRFMVEQVEAGMLVCLCSKNAEQDVLDVFDTRPDMVLKREHLVSWRINWNGKAENLVSLAQELGLGLDSVVFIDDNPVECAEVRGRCPGVLTLQLPEKSDAFGSFLDHTWAFDRTATTGEDRKRTALYQQGAERARFRDQAVSLQAFIDGLDLRVEVADAADDDLPRVAQLTERTNQFNFTTLRRSQAEIREFLRRDGAGCRVVRVSDRFGDYGLVGAVLFTTGPDRLTVDTFLLSCRVLGRGVEHAVLAAVAATAVARGKQTVELVFRPSPKNEPARNFLASLQSDRSGDAGSAEGSYTFAASDLAGLKYRPEATHAVERAAGGRSEVAAGDASPVESGRGASHGGRDSAGSNDSQALREIAEQLADINRLMARIDAHRFGRQPRDTTPQTQPGDAIETSLRRIWGQVLGRARVGLHDNFFEIGGTSLKAVQVLAVVKRELGHDLSIVSLFESPTVALMAAQLRAKTNGGATGPAEEHASGAPSGQKGSAADRGRRRRVVTTRRGS